MDRVVRTALYFPEIEIPRQWAVTSLLYCDEIASISPGPIDEVLEGDVSPHMRELAATPFYRTISPMAAVQVDGDNIFDEFASALIQLQSTRILKRAADFKQSRLVPVHHLKMQETLEELLVERGYALPGVEDDFRPGPRASRRSGDPWLLVQPEVANLYMDVLARRVAIVDTEFNPFGTIRNTTASTDAQHHRDFAFGVRRQRVGQRPWLHELALELHLLLPTPAPNTPIERILDFRSKHEQQLIRLRSFLSSFEQRLSEAEDQRELLLLMEKFKADVIQGTDELHRQLASSGFEMISGLITALLTLNAPEVLEAFAQAYGLVEKAVEVPVEFKCGSMAVAGAVGLGVAIITSRRKRSEALNDSAFSYLYALEKELPGISRP